MARRGFSLVEAIVAIALVSIVAGAFAPMAVRVLEQRRRAATRVQLRTAFEALFGSRERRLPNLRADCGFTPQTSLADLEVLLRPPARDLPVFGSHDGAAFAWGWNGPYWQGRVVAGHPADAWGDPIELVCAKAADGQLTWQVRSRSGLSYPPLPAPASGYNAAVLVVLTKVSKSIKGTVRLRAPEPGKALAVQAFPIDDSKPVQSFLFSVPAGGAELNFVPTDGQPGFQALTLPMDLLPGRTREVPVAL